MNVVYKWTDRCIIDWIEG